MAQRALAILCPLSGLAIALRGPAAVKLATRIMGIVLVAVGVLIAW